MPFKTYNTSNNNKNAIMMPAEKVEMYYSFFRLFACKMEIFSSPITNCKIEDIINVIFSN